MILLFLDLERGAKALLFCSQQDKKIKRILLIYLHGIKIILIIVENLKTNKMYKTAEISVYIPSHSELFFDKKETLFEENDNEIRLDGVNAKEHFIQLGSSIVAVRINGVKHHAECINSDKNEDAVFELYS